MYANDTTEGDTDQPCGNLHLARNGHIIVQRSYEDACGRCWGSYCWLRRGLLPFTTASYTSSTASYRSSISLWLIRNHIISNHRSHLKIYRYSTWSAKHDISCSIMPWRIPWAYTGTNSLISRSYLFNLASNTQVMVEWVAQGVEGYVKYFNMRGRRNYACFIAYNHRMMYAEWFIRVAAPRDNSSGSPCGMHMPW